MADKTVIVEIQYDTEAAVKNLQTLTSEIEGERVEQGRLKSELEKGKKSQTEYAEAVELSKGRQQKANAERKNSVKLLQSEKGSVNQLKSQIKKITSDRDKLNQSTESGKIKARAYNKQLIEMKQTLKGAQTETKKASTGFAKFGNDLQAIPGPVGGIIKGIVGMTKASLAFIATPIGAIIAALAVAIMAVRSAFKSSEEGQNKFAKIMAVIQAIIGNLNDLLADLGEKIIAAFENPQEAIKKFAELIKKNVTNRIVGLIELVPQLGKSINLLFKGEFKEAGITAGNALVKVSLGIDKVSEKLAKAIEKTKELIAENLREGASAARVADMRAKADIIERKLIVKRAELESKIAELRLKGREEDRFTAEERKKFLMEARDLQDQLLTEEKQVLILRRDAQKLENTFSRTNKENKLKEAEAIAAVSRKEAERFNQARQIQRELIRVDNQIKREEEKAAKEREKIEQDELKRRGAAIVKLAELKQQEIELESSSIKELKAIKIAAENEEFNRIIENNTLLQEEIELLEFEHKIRLIDIEKEFQEERSKIEDKARKDAFNSMQEIIMATRNFANQRVNILNNAFSKIATINFKEIKSAKDAFLQIGSAAQGLTNLIISGNEAQLRDLEIKKQSELSAVGDNEQKREAIERKFNKKLADVKRAQAKEEKRKALIDAAISTALGVTKALGSAPPPLNFVLAGLTGAAGALQIATISRQQEPEFSSDKIFAKGGIIGGRSHSMGGTKFYGDDGSKFEAEKGEAMFVLNKNATDQITALSLINENHGGRSFKSRSSYLQEGGEVESFNIERQIDEAIQRTPIFVRSGDIETGLTDFNNVKEAGVI